MPPEAVEDGRRAYAITTKTFTELLEHVRNWRVSLGVQAQQASVSQFACPGAIGEHGVRRFYALGTTAGSRDHTILYADVPQTFAGNAANTETTMGLGMGIGKGMLPVVQLKPLLRVNRDSAVYRGVMTKEEELLRERMRCMTQGITSYDYEPRSGTFLFSATGHLYRCQDNQKSDSVSPSPVDVPLNVSGAPLDPKICPANSQLVACVCRNDIYINFGPTARQATFSHDGEDGSAPKLCGVTSFIVQEEFGRFSGYWWRPVAEDDTYYILYEETDESSVLELSVNVPATRAEHVELMRYPRTGTNNPTWILKMLKIRLLDAGGDEDFDSVKDARIEERHFIHNFRELFPWSEYLVRAGWLPDGKGIWFQIMSRVQDRFALVYAPITAFGIPGECPTASFKNQNQSESMEDLTNIDEHGQRVQLAGVSILYEEHTPDMWINYHDTLHFISVGSNADEIEFVWLSGKTGFYHLYHVTASIAGSKWTTAGDEGNATLATTVKREVQLTDGDWDVRRKCQIHVDESRQLIYFTAFKDTPLEAHIYVTSYRYPGQIRRLTDSGYSYGGHRDGKPFCISADGRVLVTSRCSVTQLAECVVYSLNDDDHLPRSSLLCNLSKPVPTLTPVVDSSMVRFENSETPVLFTYDSQRTGFRHYAYLFKPLHAKPGFKYPTILYVYAGPEVQLVKNVWMGSYGFQKYTSLGYAVVIADGRGSSNRGVQFEAALKYSLGNFEIDDQVEILTEVANGSGVVDLQRVALLGWSYGGYMALQGLAQKPEVFKVAVAGAPVTVWSLYDTAYTERYMGLPQFNQESYVRSSVLSYVDCLPSESGRLLLLHGLIDENVHFRHTSILISALIRAGKPYQLQIFPADRHALRNSEVNEHMDATVLDFLQHNL